MPPLDTVGLAAARNCFPTHTVTPGAAEMLMPALGKVQNQNTFELAEDLMLLPGTADGRMPPPGAVGNLIPPPGAVGDPTLTQKIPDQKPVPERVLVPNHKIHQFGLWHLLKDPLILTSLNQRLTLDWTSRCSPNKFPNSRTRCHEWKICQKCSAIKGPPPSPSKTSGKMKNSHLEHTPLTDQADDASDFID